jgi:hypothetical protein
VEELLDPGLAKYMNLPTAKLGLVCADSDERLDRFIGHTAVPDGIVSLTLQIIANSE